MIYHLFTSLSIYFYNKYDAYTSFVLYIDSITYVLLSCLNYKGFWTTGTLLALYFIAGLLILNLAEKKRHSPAPRK